jgi:hypothetical protein
MGEFTLTDMDRLLALHDAERTFQMDEETFRSFYEQDSPPGLGLPGAAHR